MNTNLFQLYKDFSKGLHLPSHLRCILGIESSFKEAR